MAQSSGKLIPYLRRSLEECTFCNLKWMNKHSESFSLKFPRYDKKKDLQNFEKILNSWYTITGRLSKYPGYSTARSVFLAAIHNSVFLIHNPQCGNKLCYRFASPEEIKENKRMKKEKSKQKNLIIDEESPQIPNLYPLSKDSDLPLPALPSPDPPPSNSSGYHTVDDDDDDFDENMQVTTECSTSEDFDINPLISLYLESPEEHIDDDFMDVVIRENEEFVSLDDIKVDDLLKPLISIQPAGDSSLMVNISTFFNTFWMCTQKVCVDSTIILICEKQIIQDENQGITAGQVVIPNNVWEPGETYSLKKDLEVDGKYFLFFLPIYSVPYTDSLN